MNLQLKDWIFIINDDIESAEVLLNAGHYMTSVYHAHQCAEKTMKVALILRNIDIPLTHDLRQLYKLLIKVIPEIETLMHGIGMLNNYLPKLRYPYGDRLEKEDALGALHISKLIMTTLLPKEGAEE